MTIKKLFNSQVLKISCPLCGNKKSKDKWGFNLGEIRNGYYSKNFGFMPSSILAIVKCISCNFVYASPRLQPYLIEQMYNGSENSQVDDNFDQSVTERSNYRFLIQQIINIEKDNNKISLLDFGCGSGRFLREAIESGFFASVTGFEISVAYKNFLESKSLHVYSNQSQLIDEHFKSFDVVVADQVFEHVCEPANSINSIKKVLKNKGLLVIDVPNWNSVKRLILGKHWKEINPIEHINMWSYKTLKNFLTKHDFTLIRPPIPFMWALLNSSERTRQTLRCINLIPCRFKIYLRGLRIFAKLK